METTPKKLNRENKLDWCVVEGLINHSKDYIKILHKDYSLPYAIVQLGKRNTVVVEYCCGEKPWYKLVQTILANIKEDIAYCILEKGEPDPWGFALRRATTGATAYSKIQWVLHASVELTKAKPLETSNKTEDAIESLNENDSAAYRQYRLGRAHMENDELEQALTAFSRSIELEDDHANAYLWRGIALRRMENFKGALSEMNKVIELSPSYDYAYCHRGFINYLTDKYSEAITDYTRAIELNPDYAPYYSARGEVYAERGNEGDYHAAIVDFDQAIELEPDDASFYQYKADVNIKMSKLDLAEDSLNDAMGIDPGNIHAFAVLSQVRDARRYEGTIGIKK